MTVQRRRETTEGVVEEAALVTAHVTVVDVRDICLVNAQMVDKADLVAEVADMEVVVVEEATPPATIVVERVTLPVIVLRSQRKGEAVVVVAGHATDVVILDMLRVNALLRTRKLVKHSIVHIFSFFSFYYDV